MKKHYEWNSILVPMLSRDPGNEAGGFKEIGFVNNSIHQVKTKKTTRIQIVADQLERPASRQLL